MKFNFNLLIILHGRVVVKILIRMSILVTRLVHLVVMAPEHFPLSLSTMNMTQGYSFLCRGIEATGQV